MFFWLSKILWYLLNPLNLVFLGICLLAVLLWLNKVRAARILSSVMAVCAVLVTALPIGDLAIQHLENRFPANPVLPAHIDGVVVLGGVISPKLSKARGQPQLGDGMERITAVADIIRSSPNAKIIFTGGSGDPFQQQYKEADFAPQVFRQFGFDPVRVTFENNSRNTAENAKFSFAIAQPKPSETWVLVTSAFHVPRAFGTFRRAGWKIIAYPVDYNTTGTATFAFGYSFGHGMSSATRALHEGIGLLFYWLTGRTDTLYPGPNL